MQHDLLHKNVLTPSGGRGCIKGQNTCLHCVLCFIPVEFDMQHDHRKEKNDILIPQGQECMLSKTFAGM